MIIFKPHQVFHHMQKYLPENPIIVEGGAFDGKETEKMASFWPHGHVHAFEPVPAIFDKLEENTRSYTNVTRYKVALSSSNGTAQFWIAEKPQLPGIPTQAGSLRSPKERLKLSPITFPRSIMVTTTTVDAWADTAHIDRVDLLWLDIQGYELDVLQACVHILPTVRVIYAEVSFIESYAGQATYATLVAWLSDHNFTLIGTDFVHPTTHFFGNALFIRTQKL